MVNEWVAVALPTGIYLIVSLLLGYIDKIVGMPDAQSNFRPAFNVTAIH